MICYYYLIIYRVKVFSFRLVIFISFLLSLSHSETLFFVRVFSIITEIGQPSLYLV